MSKIKMSLTLAVLMVFSIFVFACFAAKLISNNPQLNIILITLNSTRADHLSCYGYKRLTSPNIDNFAKEAIIFEQATAQSSWTLPSQASIFTSKYACNHGVYNRNQKLSNEELTLPEILKIHEYVTAAFVGGLDLSCEYGFDQGFDYYDDDTKGKPMGSLKDIIPKAVSWLKENKKQKFFLFLQSYDAHPPFSQPAQYNNMHDTDYNGMFDKLPLDYNILKNIHNNILFHEGEEIKLTKDDINHIIARYDGGIRYADEFIGNFLKDINEMGLLENTIIIITSEHGEELSDHGSFDRFGKKNLYEEVIHVPLIIKYPCASSRGKRVANQVQLIDIMPTILDFLGIPINKKVQGTSLVPLIEGRNVDKDFNRYVYSEADTDKRSIRSNKWKLICDNGKYELYNLGDNPLEINNLANQRPEIVYELMQRLAAWNKNARTDNSLIDNRLELTDEMKEKLREAGYW